MKKITTILLLSFLVAIITVVSIMALSDDPICEGPIQITIGNPEAEPGQALVPAETQCYVGDGGQMTCGFGGSVGPSDKCDPDEVARICCKVVKSKNQCNNRCDSKAQTCNWNSGETTTCKTRVTQDCTLV